MEMNLPLQFVVSTVGTLAFSVLFHAPPRHYLRCGLIGGLGWVVFLLIRQHSGSLQLACFFAAFALTILARLVAIWCKTPVIVFITAGMFPLVPGTGIYNTAYHLFTGSPDIAMAKGLETLLIAGAISIGILFGSFVPQQFFVRFNRLARRFLPHAAP